MDKNKIRKKVEKFEGTHRREHFEHLSFTIMLVQPETAGNVGSVARLMKNFNFHDLVVFNPIAPVEEISSYETQGFAMHGRDILLNSDIVELDDQKSHLKILKSYLNDYDLTIGTTAKGKHFTNINRSTALFPEDLELPVSDTPLKIAILFGKESRGLTNQELDLIDILLRIPADDSYPTLNLSHAAGIILYEFFKKLHKITLGRGKNPVLLADREDRQILYEHIQTLIKTIKIRRFRKMDSLRAFKNIFERTIMSNRELSLILGLFSKLNSVLEDIDLFKEENT